MADLLTHVLFAYGVLTLLSLRWQWVREGYVTIGMAGALGPDVGKAYLLFEDSTIQMLLGLPFEWYGIHTIGGVIILSGLIATWVDHSGLVRVFYVSLFGGGTHLLLDCLIKEPTGYSYAALWPLTYHRVPSLGVYISTDLWPLLTMSIFAATTWMVASWDGRNLIGSS